MSVPSTSSVEFAVPFNKETQTLPSSAPIVVAQKAITLNQESSSQEVDLFHYVFKALTVGIGAIALVCVVWILIVMGYGALGIDLSTNDVFEIALPALWIAPCAAIGLYGLWEGARAVKARLCKKVQLSL